MSKNIKTVSLTANTETKIDITGGTHVNIENRVSGVVYVSKYSNVVPNGDGVMAIDNGTSKTMRDVATYSVQNGTADYYGTIYALSDSDTTIEITTANDLNFKKIVKGGGEMSNFATEKNFLEHSNIYIDTFIGNIKEGE